MNEESATSFDLDVVLWLLAALVVFQFLLAVRAWWIERREGFVVSRARLLGSFVALVLTAGLALLAYLPLSPGSPAAPVETPAPAVPAGAAAPDTTAPAEGVVPDAPRAAEEASREKRLARIEARRQELAALERRRAKLEEELAVLESEVGVAAAPQPGAGSDASAAPAGDEETGGGALLHKSSVVFYLLWVVLGAAVLLVVFGDPSHLLPEAWMRRLKSGREARERAAKAREKLDRLTTAVEEGDYAEALALYRDIDPTLLEGVDRLDRAYLGAFAAVAAAGGGAENDEDGENERGQQKQLLEDAVTWLDELLEEAPNRGEAQYLRGHACGVLGRSEDALGSFARAREELGHTDLAFDRNESVCLLGLAEDRLTQGDPDGANALFEEVSSRKVLAAEIPNALVRIRFFHIGRSLREGNVEEAEAGIRSVRALEGLEPAKQEKVALTCDVFEVLLLSRRGDDRSAVDGVGRFLARHLPDDFPPLDDEIVDEALEPPIDYGELSIPAPVYRTFLFLQAACQARLLARGGRAPTRAQVDEIATALRQAFVFDLRNRELLAAFGGLCVWFVPEKRAQGLAWLESAVTLGTSSRLAREILEREKMVELEYKERLEWFRGNSVRFLRDPTLRREVRAEYLEELSHFREFEPILQEIEAAPELAPREPTLSVLRERARHLMTMVGQLVEQRGAEDAAELLAKQREYQLLVRGLEGSETRRQELEQQLMTEMGKLVLT